jgi:choline kinase
VTGIILAAGRGTRLRGIDVPRAKCIVPFAGVPLIQWQLDALRCCGIEDITVVVGFDSDRVRLACGAGVRFIENPDFADTNSLFSFSLARTRLDGGFVVMNCDVLFHPTILADLLTSRHDNAALVAYPLPGDPEYDDEEMKVCVRRGRIVDIRKDLPPSKVDGENVGIAKFNAAGASRLLAIMDRLSLPARRRNWAPFVFREFARQNALYAVGTRGLPWTEIDTPDDYRRAVHQVFPAIRAACDAEARAETDVQSQTAIERSAPVRRGA